jgi:hypothetical protein
MALGLFGIDDGGLNLAVNLLVLFLIVLWLALVAWTYLDARRRIQDKFLVACATAGSVFPFVGPIVYAILRPPEFLEDAHERELEIRAAELRVRQLTEQSCPNCEHPVERSYLRCPNCRTRLKDPCPSCAKPIDPRWSVCPYCELPIQRRRRPAQRRPDESKRAGQEGRRPERARAEAKRRPARPGKRPAAPAAPQADAAAEDARAPRKGVTRRRKSKAADAPSPEPSGTSQATEETSVPAEKS